MKIAKQQFDIAIIGGGPAGMMAAGRAGELGARVVLVEKNPAPGKKLLLTGNGRCNLTQKEFDPKIFLQKINAKNKFLLSALTSFGPKKVIDFFEKNNLKTKEEANGRIFPVSNKAQDVLDTLIRHLRKNNVAFRFQEEVAMFVAKNGKIKSLLLKNGEEIVAKKFILATGGKSYPKTGSTGDGYVWAKKLGHTVISPLPALTPIKIKETWVKNLPGISLKNITLRIIQNEKTVLSSSGDILFTHFGLSGPLVLNLSKTIGQLKSKDQVFLEIDFWPTIPSFELNKKLQHDFELHSQKNLKKYLSSFFPEKLASAFSFLAEIDPQKKLHSLNKAERKKLLDILKKNRLETDGLLGFQQAMITSGGVNLKEINSQTMQSKVVPNLYLAGEILDLDAPTGGYNLQICWSTGYLAGTNAAKE